MIYSIERSKVTGKKDTVPGLVKIDRFSDYITVYIGFRDDLLA